MKYEKIKKGIFLKRPNRFLAQVLIDGKEELCHVKNTGRCKELLVPKAEVYVECHNNEKRKTVFRNGGKQAILNSRVHLVNVDDLPSIIISIYLVHLYLDPA